MAVNLSDLAAMGAEPRWCTLALTLPTADELWLDGFSRGLFELAERYGVSLVGGNLTPRAADADAAAHGARRARTRAARGGGHVGDDVYVTGTLGDSAAGIALIIERVDGAARLRGRGAQGTLLPARAARRRRARARARSRRAAIDVSDGLLADLGHICERERLRRRRSTSSACRCRPSSCRCSRRKPRSRTRSAAATTTSSASLRAAVARAGRSRRRSRHRRHADSASASSSPGAKSSCRRDGEPFEPPCAAIATSDAAAPMRDSAGGALLDPVHFVALGFGAGLAPRAPGTFGSARRAAARPGGCFALPLPWRIGIVVAVIAARHLDLRRERAAARRPRPRRHRLRRDRGRSAARRSRAARKLAVVARISLCFV